jgi:hypothetical protein
MDTYSQLLLYGYDEWLVVEEAPGAVLNKFGRARSVGEAFVELTDRADGTPIWIAPTSVSCIAPGGPRSVDYDVEGADDGDPFQLDPTAVALELRASRPAPR